MKQQVHQIAGDPIFAEAVERFANCTTTADFRGYLGPHPADPWKSALHLMVALAFVCQAGQRFIRAKFAAASAQGRFAPGAGAAHLANPLTVPDGNHGDNTNGGAK